jgi:hypothetical protein
MFRAIFLAAALAAVAVFLPGQASAAGVCPSSFAGHQALTCFCTPAQMTGTVWGSGPYTTDSSVCAAALHAGAIARTGGMVTAQASHGCNSYRASANNGVATTAYGPWNSSFYFPSVGTPNCPGQAAAPVAPAPVGPCPQTFQGMRGSLTCMCSPTHYTGQVWGTLTYTEDSSVCMAALHAGAIGRNGGAVTVRSTQGCPGYSGTINNGVASADYGAWGSSFYFPSIGGGACSAPGPHRRRPPGR